MTNQMMKDPDPPPPKKVLGAGTHHGDRDRAPRSNGKAEKTLGELVQEAIADWIKERRKRT